MTDASKDAVRTWATPCILLAIAGFLAVGFLDFKDSILSEMGELRSDVRHMSVELGEMKARAFVTRREVEDMIKIRLLELKADK